MSCLAQSSPASEPSKAQQQVVTCWLHFQLPEQVSCRPRFPQPRQGELKIRLPASLSKALQWWAGHELTEPLSAAAAVRMASTRGGGRPIRHSTCGHTFSLKMNEGKENPSFEKNKKHEKHTVHGILQARILEWVAIPFSRGSSQPRDRNQISCIAEGFFTS